MEKLDEVLAKLMEKERNLNPTGVDSQDSSPSETEEPERILDPRIMRIQQQIAKRQEALNKASIATKVISSPEQCPWQNNPWRMCEECRDGKREDSQLEPVPIKIVYDVRECYSEVRYRELIGKSGLVGIELTHTFENAIIDRYNRDLYTYLMEWDPTTGNGIYISVRKDPQNPQGNGTGKSYALHALTHRLCRMGIPCLYARTVDFLMELRAAYDEGSQESETKVLRRYTQVPVLLWDDLGKERFKSDWGPEKFYYVIDYRVRARKPIVISSNFSLDDIEERFGDENFGPAIVSRLAGFCEVWTLGGPDRRIRKIK